MYLEGSQNAPLDCAELRVNRLLSSSFSLWQPSEQSIASRYSGWLRTWKSRGSQNPPEVFCYSRDGQCVAPPHSLRLPHATATPSQPRSGTPKLSLLTIQLMLPARCHSPNRIPPNPRVSKKHITVPLCFGKLEIERFTGRTACVSEAGCRSSCEEDSHMNNTNTSFSYASEDRVCAQRSRLLLPNVSKQKGCTTRDKSGTKKRTV